MSVNIRISINGSPSPPTPLPAYLDVPPAWVVVEAIVDVVMQALGEPVHEGGAGSDAVGVKVFLLGLLGGHSVA